jgi:predicted nucleic-acid-binding protein
MIGLDTNVLVRFVVQDDPAQTALATALIDEELTVERRGFISAVVLTELIWTLETRYRADRKRLAEMVDRFLATEVFSLERPEDVARALDHYRASKADFADHLIVETAMSNGCTEIVTFDRSLARTPNARLLA